MLLASLLPAAEPRRPIVVVQPMEACAPGDRAYAAALAKHAMRWLREGGVAADLVDDRALEFHTVDKAAGTLARLVGDEAFREARLRHCAERARKFTLNAYREHQQEVVGEMCRCVPSP